MEGHACRMDQVLVLRPQAASHLVVGIHLLPRRLVRRIHRMRRPQGEVERRRHPAAVRVRVREEVPVSAVRRYRAQGLCAVARAVVTGADGIRRVVVRIPRKHAAHEAVRLVPLVLLAERASERGNVDVVLRRAVVSRVRLQSATHAAQRVLARRRTARQGGQHVLGNGGVIRRVCRLRVVHEGERDPSVVAHVDRAVIDGVACVAAGLRAADVRVGGCQQRHRATRRPNIAELLGDAVERRGVQQICEAVQDPFRHVELAAFRQVDRGHRIVVHIVAAAREDRVRRAGLRQLAEFPAIAPAQGLRAVGPQQAVALPGLRLEVLVHDLQTLLLRRARLVPLRLLVLSLLRDLRLDFRDPPSRHVGLDLPVVVRLVLLNPHRLPPCGQRRWRRPGVLCRHCRGERRRRRRGILHRHHAERAVTHVTIAERTRRPADVASLPEARPLPAVAAAHLMLRVDRRRRAVGLPTHWERLARHRVAVRPKAALVVEVPFPILAVHDQVRAGQRRKRHAAERVPTVQVATDRARDVDAVVVHLADVVVHPEVALVAGGRHRHIAEGAVLLGFAAQRAGLPA
mmetsp:Transcript_70117/g.203325  ORF Transcript_70117/g.203325 Transcript_70117/m.203325 type:complete len:573 (-) Transcript_70117:933-2651(-)